MTFRRIFPRMRRLPGIAAAIGLVTSLFMATAICAAEPKPIPVALMTGLPIIWGEGDIGDTLSGRNSGAQSYRYLAENFDVKPIDAVEENGLAPFRLLILAQPRGLHPTELVEIDAWMRAGGRALILADPLLQWDSRFGLGDPRSPPAMSLLDPLLDHWGLRLDLPRIDPQPEQAAAHVSLANKRRVIAVMAPGTFVATGANCTVHDAGLIARCAVGKGRAVLIADADFMSDTQWNQDGTTNALALRTAADELLGISRDDEPTPSSEVVNNVNSLETLILPVLSVFLLGIAGFFLWRSGSRFR